MKKLAILILILISGRNAFAQQMKAYTDSLRKQYKVPELGYAVLSADTVLEMHIGGENKTGSGLQAALTDRFRIGSNTKAVTSLLAEMLVQQGKLRFDTRFFDVLPELKKSSDPGYAGLTLTQLLSMRAPLPPYTYTNKLPAIDQFNGDGAAQRRQFAVWLLQQKPSQQQSNGLYLTNAGYILAGVMLEKASGKSYVELVQEFNERWHTDFATGNPNATDSNQVWGHNSELQPEAPQENIKLEWLQAAGNLNTTLPGYISYLQTQLKAFRGMSPQLSKSDIEFMHYHLPVFSFGWMINKDAPHIISHNIGNPGTFYTAVQLIPAANRAYVIFTNSQTKATEEAVALLMDTLQTRYGK
ncbi:serine hydrolase [Chitinophaga sp. Cy-1792]|uniref:serine hydrolase domain-containing protein n=1 Tax=Chitinophaga sp. Cy-1792 TaxID=2608339 RepID=UPI0014214728|nr:serine hydrolase domain-containing protein [Chitinophaga sp. Cy-1792]